MTIKGIMTSLTAFQEGIQRHLIGGLWASWLILIVVGFSESPLFGVITSGLCVIAFILWEVFQKTGNTLKEQIKDVLVAMVAIIPITTILILRLNNII